MLADINQFIQAENWKLSDEIMDAKITYLLPLSICTRTWRTGMHGFLSLDNSACSLALLKLYAYYWPNFTNEILHRPSK